MVQYTSPGCRTADNAWMCWAQAGGGNADSAGGLREAAWGGTCAGWMNPRGRLRQRGGRKGQEKRGSSISSVAGIAAEILRGYTCVRGLGQPQGSLPLLVSADGRGAGLLEKFGRPVPGAAFLLLLPLVLPPRPAARCRRQLGRGAGFGRGGRGLRSGGGGVKPRRASQGRGQLAPGGGREGAPGAGRTHPAALSLPQRLSGSRRALAAHLGGP